MSDAAQMLKWLLDAAENAFKPPFGANIVLYAKFSNMPKSKSRNPLELEYTGMHTYIGNEGIL